VECKIYSIIIQELWLNEEFMEIGDFEIEIEMTFEMATIINSTTSFGQ